MKCVSPFVVAAATFFRMPPGLGLRLSLFLDSKVLADEQLN